MFVWCVGLRLPLSNMSTPTTRWLAATNSSPTLPVPENNSRTVREALPTGSGGNGASEIRPSASTFLNSKRFPWSCGLTSFRRLLFLRLRPVQGHSHLTEPNPNQRQEAMCCISTRLVKEQDHRRLEAGNQTHHLREAQCPSLRSGEGHGVNSDDAQALEPKWLRLSVQLHMTDQQRTAPQEKR